MARELRGEDLESMRYATDQIVAAINHPGFQILMRALQEEAKVSLDQFLEVDPKDDKAIDELQRKQKALNWFEDKITGFLEEASAVESLAQEQTEDE